MADSLSQRKRDLEEIKKLSLEIQRVENDTAMSESKRLKTLDDLGKKRKELANQIKEVNKLIQGRLDYLKEEEKSISSINGAYSKFKDSQKSALSIAESFVGNDEEKQKIITKTLELSRDLSSVSPEQTKEYEAASNALKDQLELNKSLLAGNDELISALENQAYQSETISMASEFQKKQMEQTYEITQKINQGLQTTFGVIRTLFSSVGGFVGTLAIGAGSIGKKLAATSKELGTSILDTSNISTTLFGTVFPDAVGTTKSLSKEFGGLNDVSLQTQLRTNLISKNLGISAGEAASLTGSFARLNDGSAETAQNLISSTKALAQQNGLVPSDVMADVANSAEAFALFGKDGGKNIAEAAVAAGKLGISMDKVTGITENLLDFENSINAELELGAMLGRNINLDRARALAFEGDIGGAVRETLSSLGGIEEFNKMDYFQKKQTAALLGVSVDEFQKMAANADKLNKDGSIQVSQYQQTKELLKGMASQGFSLLQGLGSAAIAAGQMGFNLKGIGGTMKGIVGGIGQKFKGLFGQDALSKARNNLSDKQIASGFGGKKAKDMLASKSGGVTQSLSDKANPARKGGMMDSMSKINMNAVLKGAAAMVIVAGAVFVFGKAVQEFMKVSWEAVGMAVVSMLALVGAVSLLGAIMTSGVGTVAILAGAAAMLVIAASVLVLGNALQAIGTGFEMMANGIGTLMPQLTSVATTIGGLVVLIPAITLLSASLMGLSGSLMALGVAGVLAGPGLLALSAVGTVSQGLNSLLGGGEEGGGGDSDLINEIRGLREDLNTGKVAVYLDGQKVTAGVSKVVSKVGSNSYAT